MAAPGPADHAPPHVLAPRPREAGHEPARLRGRRPGGVATRPSRADAIGGSQTSPPRRTGGIPVVPITGAPIHSEGPVGPEHPPRCVGTQIAVAQNRPWRTVLRRRLQGYGDPGVGVAQRIPTGASSRPTPAGPAAENARPKHDLGRARMDRDVPRRWPSSSSERPSGEPQPLGRRCHAGSGRAPRPAPGRCVGPIRALAGGAPHERRRASGRTGG